MPTAAEFLAAAVSFHQAGRLQEAEAYYRQAIQLAPDNAQAWHFFGGLAYQVGNAGTSIELLKRAAELEPRNAEYWLQLGLLLEEQQRLSEAATCYQRVLQLAPDQLEAAIKLGGLLSHARQYADSVEVYRRALQHHAASGDLHFLLGDALFALERKGEAAECYSRAIEQMPMHAAAHSNLGNALHSQRKYAEATAAFRRALDLAPQRAEIHNNLGNVLRDQSRVDEAIEAYHNALRIDSNLAEAHNGLGVCLREKMRIDEAVVCFQRACALKAELADAACNLGTALRDQAQLPESIAELRRAIELDPSLFRAHGNLAYALWFCPGYSQTQIYEEHQRLNQQHALPLAAKVRPYRNDRSPDRRLRVGYVSPNFRDHVQSLFMTPLLAAHDHEQFEIVAYADQFDADAITERLRPHFDLWRDTNRLTDDELADLMRADRIDILVDQTMHMAQSRLLVFAQKPAPVQVTWLAYPGTTGLTAIDYRITDPRLDPPGMFEGTYAEATVWLPDTYWCYDPLDEITAVNRLPALDRGYVTFGCLNQFTKVNADVLTLWARVLQAVPKSRLLLLAEEGSSRQRVLDSLGKEQIDPARLEFFTRQRRQAYLEAHHRIDIGLDTFPYNGHTTTLDSLWMGVPVVSRLGETIVGRAGLSILHNVGLENLVAKSDGAFVETAVQLAKSLEDLARLRSSLRDTLRRSALMDGPRFTRHFEAAYRTMWQAWCQS